MIKIQKIIDYNRFLIEIRHLWSPESPNLVRKLSEHGAASQSDCLVGGASELKSLLCCVVFFFNPYYDVCYLVNMRL